MSSNKILIALIIYFFMSVSAVLLSANEVLKHITNVTTGVSPYVKIYSVGVAVLPILIGAYFCIIGKWKK